ncbi:MAG: glycosyltransferase family 1 protein, partial [Pseudomonadota bacterium]
GVVTTLSKTAAMLERMGHEVRCITPQGFKTFPCPTYPSIRLALKPAVLLRAMLDAYAPDAIHIATEGPLGWAARAYCHDRGLRFTTSYHTQMPEYIRLRTPIPLSVSYSVLRRFHRPAACTLVPTESQRQRLLQRGFENVVIWSRGVDTDLFHPGDKFFLAGPRPIAMYMGRVAVEKNIEDFLDLQLPGSKYVVGDGPDLESLRRRYPNVHFTGFKHGAELAAHLAAADVFVFPSCTDTFGLVLLEAMACGVPVAAYPVTGPIDVVTPRVTGCLDEDLGRAVHGALQLDGARCRQYALKHSWSTATAQFLKHLATAQAEQSPAELSRATSIR